MTDLTIERVREKRQYLEFYLGDRSLPNHVAHATRENIAICDLAIAELEQRDERAALRARHEKLRELVKALVEEWRDTANYGTDPDKSAAERLLFDTVHAHADELNALLKADLPHQHQDQSKSGR